VYFYGKPAATETTRQGKSCFLPDIIRVIVGKDMKPPQSAWRLECFNAAFG
jgi:hypothetical protein